MELVTTYPYIKWITKSGFKNSLITNQSHFVKSINVVVIRDIKEKLHRV